MFKLRLLVCASFVLLTSTACIFSLGVSDSIDDGQRRAYHDYEDGMSPSEVESEFGEPSRIEPMSVDNESFSVWEYDSYAIVFDRSERSVACYDISKPPARFERRSK